MYLVLHSGLIGLLVCLFIGLFLSSASAQTMSNKDYIIQIQGFNAASGTTTNANYTLRSTAGEVATGVSENEDFKIKAGFENIVSSSPFFVLLSADIIDFGTLSPTNPIIRTVNLSVYSLPLYGYSIIAYENHPLKNGSEPPAQIIPDTTCDNGQCNEENAGAWTNTLTYGFGYRCDNLAGNDCGSSFSNPSFYKHFADISNSTAPSVMKGIGSENKDIRLSYKVNIPGTQPEGIYSNIITYIAVPNF